MNAVPPPARGAAEFSGPARLTLPTARSAIRLGRYRHVADAPTMRIDTTSEDAFLAIFQLRSHPPHRLCAGGAEEQAPCARQGSLHILDLSAPISTEHDADMDSLHVHLPRQALDDLAAEIGGSPVSHVQASSDWSTQDGLLRQLQPAILTALDGGDDSSRLYADQLMQIVARHIAYTYGGLRLERRQVGGLAPWQVRRSKEMIAGDLTRQPALAEVAAACGLSTAHFARAFKASVGQTPHDCLQASRVEHSRTLLRQAGLSLAEIALACGFADQSHFTRMFKRATGQTPGSWRGQREPVSRHG